MNISEIRENDSQFKQNNFTEYQIEVLHQKIIQSIKDNLITFISSKTGSG